MESLKTKVSSSNIDEIEFIPDTNTLIVTFKGGNRYKYTGVKREIYDAIVEEKFTNQKGEPSSGATFIKLVKDNPNYKYIKIN